MGYQLKSFVSALGLPGRLTTITLILNRIRFQNNDFRRFILNVRFMCEVNSQATERKAKMLVEKLLVFILLVITSKNITSFEVH